MKPLTAIPFSTLFLFVLFFQSCLKPKDYVNINYSLTEEEKTWLPYNRGDSLYLITSDSIIYPYVVDHLEFNKDFLSSDLDTRYFSYTKEIHLRSVSDTPSYSPKALILSPKKDDVIVEIEFDSVNDQQSFNTSTINIKGEINPAPLDIITIDFKKYTDVKNISNENGSFKIKQGIGILNVVTPEKRTYKIKTN